MYNNLSLFFYQKWEKRILTSKTADVRLNGMASAISCQVSLQFAWILSRTIACSRRSDSEG